MTPIISSYGATETPGSVSGSIKLSKKKAEPTRAIKPAWIAAAHLIRAFFATYSVGVSGVLKSKVMIRRKSALYPAAPDLALNSLIKDVRGIIGFFLDNTSTRLWLVNTRLCNGLESFDRLLLLVNREILLGASVEPEETQTRALVRRLKGRLRASLADYRP